MKNIFVPLLMIIMVYSVPVAANPLVVRCSASAQWGEKTIAVRIDIVLPDELDETLVISDTKRAQSSLSDPSSVGVGMIQVTESLGSEKQSHRHKLVVTRMPSKNNSLIGFYVAGPYVNTIRANLWGKKKSFRYLDTYNDETLNGKCD